MQPWMTKFPTQYHNSQIHNQPLNHKSNKHKNPIQQTHERMKEKEERKSLTKSNSQNPRTNSQNRKTLEKQIKTLTNNNQRIQAWSWSLPLPTEQIPREDQDSEVEEQQKTTDERDWVRRRPEAVCPGRQQGAKEEGDEKGLTTAAVGHRASSTKKGSRREGNGWEGGGVELAEEKGMDEKEEE